MSYLNPPYDDNFKELCASMPLFYLDVFEMREILKAQGRLMDDVCEGFERTVNNNFIILADEEAVRKWERFFEVRYETMPTLEQRKAVIMGHVCGYGHFGEPEIRQVIAQYTPAGVLVAFSKGVIYITIDSEIFDETALMDTLLARRPAHLRIAMTTTTRRTFRAELPVAFGGAIGAAYNPQFVAEPRTSRMELHVAHGGAVTPEISGDPPPVKRASTLHREGAAGGFYYTHITSKLIKEEE